MAHASTRRTDPVLPEGETAAPEADDPEALGEVVLPLSAMISDASGEVVLFNDSGLRSLVVRTDAQLTGKGQSPRHVTAGGDDVSGFRFMTFDNGIKLYYHPDLDLVLTRETA